MRQQIASGLAWAATLMVLTAAALGCGGGTATTGTAPADAGSEPDVPVAAADAADAAGPGGADEQSGTPDAATPPLCVDPAPFEAAAKGSGPWQLVGDVTIPTLQGDWSLAEQWNGCDTYLFIGGSTDAKYKPIQQAWQDMKLAWLKALPKRGHVFFMSYSQSDADAEAHVNDQRDHLLQYFSDLTEDDQAYWTEHLHFVSVSAWNIPGWIGTTLKSKGVFFFAIDGRQRRRELGMPQLPGAAKLDPSLLALEMSYLVMDRDRDAKLAGSNATVISLAEDLPAGAGWSGPGKVLEAELPAGAALGEFDTLELDLTQLCGQDHSDASCPDWDREGFLYLCGQPAATELPAVASACTADAQLACTCQDSAGRTQAGQRACEGGTGFGACVCPCDTELYRMITSYKRQGRWITDLSPLLPLLEPGGKTRFRWYTVDDWRLTASLRLSKKGTATKPVQAEYLWGTQQFNASYNDQFAPRTVVIPAATKAVKLVALITGHGSATDTLNCAEFCPFTNHFTVGTQEFVVEHADAGTQKGCMNKVLEGVLPNQAGTWPYGRAGWCPGWDVKPWVQDVTAAAKPGTTVTLSYKGLLGGKVFQPVPTGKGDYAPVIKMSSYLVFEQ